MDFIEGRIDIEPWQLSLLSGLLKDLNQAGLTTFARSLREKTRPKALEVPWADKARCFEGSDGSGQRFTTHQAGMVVRHARNLRKASNAKSKWLAEHHAKMAEDCGKTIERSLSELERLSKQLASPFSLDKPSLKRKLRELITKIKLGITRVRGRQQRLASSSKRHSSLSESGLASQVFGGAKLARQVHGLGHESSPFNRKADWDQAWHEARSQSWLFEGDKAAASANKNAKMDLDAGLLRIRLTDKQALACGTSSCFDAFE